MDDQQPAERRCPICGATVPSDARYCPSCGNRLADADPAVPSPSFTDALEDVLDDEPATPAAPEPQPDVDSPPVSVWGPNEPVDVRPSEDEPGNQEPDLSRPILAPDAGSTAPQPTASEPPVTATGWATTPGHWTNQEQPPIRQQGWRGNRTMWLIVGIIGIILFCCCGFFFLVSAISATETSAAIHAVHPAI